MFITLCFVIFLYILPACDDLFDVYEEVHTLAAKWSHICFALKLPWSEEQIIHKESHGDDCVHCLQVVLRKWLQKSYNYDKHGPPTWRMLVRAVCDPAGGNDCALAESIAKKHAGRQLILCCVWMYLCVCVCFNR